MISFFSFCFLILSNSKTCAFINGDTTESKHLLVELSCLEVHGVKGTVDGGSDCWPDGAHGVRRRVDGGSDCWPEGAHESERKRRRRQ